MNRRWQWGSASLALAFASAAAGSALAGGVASATPKSSPVEAPAPAPAEPEAGEPEEVPDPPESTVPGSPPRSVTLLDGKPVSPSNIPFHDGESLTFTATWTGITVGDATMTVDTGGTFEGKPAIHLKATASSGRAFSLFFSIRDAGESWVDPEGLYSLGFVSDQKEGSIEDYQKWVMEYDQGVATRHRARRKDGGAVKNSTKDYKLTRTHVQDAFSMTYFFRAFPITVGSVLESDVFVSKKVWNLKVEVLSKEKVRVPAGTFECLKVKPEVSLNGKKQNKGQMTIWVTNDERKMPVKIQSDVPLGKVNAVLTKYKEGKKPE